MDSLDEEDKKVLEMRKQRRVEYSSGWTPELIEAARKIREYDWEISKEMDRIFEKDVLDTWDKHSGYQKPSKPKILYWPYFLILFFLGVGLYYFLSFFLEKEQLNKGPFPTSVCPSLIFITENLPHHLSKANPIDIEKKQSIRIQYTQFQEYKILIFEKQSDFLILDEIYTDLNSKGLATLDLENFYTDTSWFIFTISKNISDNTLELYSEAIRESLEAERGSEIIISSNRGISSSNSNDTKDDNNKTNIKWNIYCSSLDFLKSDKLGSINIRRK